MRSRVEIRQRHEGWSWEVGEKGVVKGIQTYVKNDVNRKGRSVQVKWVEKEQTVNV